MANTQASLTNINLLSKAQYDAIESPATDELWAVEGDPLGAPSDNMIDLSVSVGVEKSYIAPANGYVLLRVGSTAGLCEVRNQTAHNLGGRIGNTSAYNEVFAPCKKGDVMIINVSGSVSFCRFIYAEGEI